MSKEDLRDLLYQKASKEQDALDLSSKVCKFFFAYI